MSFYLVTAGREPEACADAASAASKASVVSAMHGIRVDVVQQRERDRVVVATAERGIVANIAVAPEPPAPTPFDGVNKRLDGLINVIKEKI